MGSFDGNQSAKRGRELNDKFVEYAKENPERFMSLILTAYDIADGTIEAQIKDRLAALNLVFDRTLGKPKQSHTHSGDPSNPLTLAWPLPKTKLDL